MNPAADPLWQFMGNRIGEDSVNSRNLRSPASLKRIADALALITPAHAHDDA
jgi:hypothetical protein